MGNKNSNKNKNTNNKQDNKYMKELGLKIKELYENDNKNKLEINKTFKPKKDIKFGNSNLKENLESNNLIDICLYITSNLYTKSINHEINPSLYNPILIPQIFENDINFENENLNLMHDSNLIIDMIYKTLCNKNEEKYNNWIPVPVKKEKSLIDDLENFSSIHAQSEGNLSSYDIEGKIINTRNEGNEENKDLFNIKIEEKNKKKEKEKEKEKEKGGNYFLVLINIIFSYKFYFY
jgi:hypothetical protein